MINDQHEDLLIHHNNNNGIINSASKKETSDYTKIEQIEAQKVFRHVSTMNSR